MEFAASLSSAFPPLMTREKNRKIISRKKKIQIYLCPFQFDQDYQYHHLCQRTNSQCLYFWHKQPVQYLCQDPKLGQEHNHLEFFMKKNVIIYKINKFCVLDSNTCFNIFCIITQSARTFFNVYFLLHFLLFILTKLLSRSGFRN